MKKIYLIRRNSKCNQKLNLQEILQTHTHSHSLCLSHTHTHTRTPVTYTHSHFSLSHWFSCHPGEFTALAVLTSSLGCPCCVHCVSLSELFVCHSLLTALLLSTHGSLQATNHWRDFTSQDPCAQATSPPSTW